MLAGYEAPLPPGEVRLPSDDVEVLHYRWERGISLAQARADVARWRADGPEARRLEARLKTAEPNNFVELGAQRAPVLAWKFSFKREPERTLRRYSSNPRFVAASVAFTQAEADALWSEWWPKLEPYATYGGRGTEGVSIGMKMTEAEFRALRGFEGFNPPPGVKLDFPKEPELPRATPDAARFLRIFPQQRYFPGIIPTGGRVYRGDARIVLRDGCLFLGNALVRLNRTMGLFRDAQGYLALRDRADLLQPYLRIGERISGGGGYSEPVDEATRRWMTSHCGDHPIIDLYSPASVVNQEEFNRSQYSP
ncbi:MAG TPA: hypothetical protein VM326_01335 [Sphingomicrobium sp.]|nr:hypothetical protein [Sphingomicrobium sp.]